MELQSVYLTVDGAANLPRWAGGALLGLREGFEAGIVVMVLGVLLVRCGRSDALRWVAVGAVTAIVAVTPIVLAVYYGVSTAPGLSIEIISGIASIVAAAIVSSMLLWLRSASNTYSGDLTTGMSTALAGGPAAVTTLAFLAVGREGVETALLLTDHADGTPLPLIGVAMGAAVAAMLIRLLHKAVLRSDSTAFFNWSGLLLVLVSAGILGSGIGALQRSGWLPGANAMAFDASSWFDISSWYGAILHGIFGLRPDPTVLQMCAWAGYLVLVAALLIRPARSHASAGTPL